MNVEAIVKEALDNACDNGYEELCTHSPLAIAHDLKENCSDLEDIHLSDICDGIIVWQTERGII